MANPAIPREQVHSLAEACSEEGTAFQSTALRLVREQRRLSRFVEQNAVALGPQNGQVALYLMAVVIRIFERSGGRLDKVPGRDIDDAAARVQAEVDALLPADDAFAGRAKAVAWRAQPHLLDEALWALFERGKEDKKEGEVDMPPTDAALVYLLLWTVVEALDRNWRAAG